MATVLVKSNELYWSLVEGPFKDAWWYLTMSAANRFGQDKVFTVPPGLAATIEAECTTEFFPLLRRISLN